MSGSEVPNWHPLWELDKRLKNGESLTLDNQVLAVLRRTARDVAISDTEIEIALSTLDTATSLLRETVRRIDDGWDRLGPALHRMYQLRDAGDFEGARQQMRDVLAVEVVPHYRNIAQGQLEQLDDWEAKAKPA